VSDDRYKRRGRRGFVTTRGEYQWNDEQQRYVLVKREGYEYDGPWALAHTNAVFEQPNWRFRYDDGTLSTATFAAAQNTNANSGQFSPGNKFRIRFNLGDTANGDSNNTGTPTIQYRVNTGGGFGSWTSLTTAYQNGIRLTSSDNSITDGANDTTQRLSTITGSVYQSAWNEYDDNQSLTSRTYTDDYCEFEFCLQVNTGTEGNVYELRLLDPTGNVPDVPPSSDAQFTVKAPLTCSGTPSIASPTASGTSTITHKITAAVTMTAVTAAGVAMLAPKVWLNSTATLSGATQMTVTAWNTAGTSITFTDPSGAPTGSLQLGVEARNQGGGEANTGWIAVTVSAPSAKTGSGTPSIDSPTASGTATYIHTDTGAPSIDSPTASGVSAFLHDATGTPSIESPTASGAVTYIHTDSASPSIESPTASGVSALGSILEASGTVQADSPTASGSVTYVHTDSATPSIDAVTASGVSAFLHDGTGTPSIDAVTASGTSVRFLAASGSPSIASPTASGVSAEDPTVTHYMLGAVTTSSARFAIRSTSAPPALLVSTNSNLSAPTTTATGTLTADSMYKYEATGLSANTTYYYGHIFNENLGSFTTAPTGQANFSIVFASCSQDSSNADTYARMADRSPAFFMQMGDWGYPDITTDNDSLYYTNYKANLGQSNQQNLMKNVPLVYMWDDHDYSNNDSEASSAAKPAALTTYRNYVPHYDLVYDTTPDADPITHTFVWGGVRFVMLDQRSARVSSGTAGLGKRLGDTQRDWLIDLIDNFTEEAMVICVGTPWINTSGTQDDWGETGAANGERELIANAIERRRGRVLIVHGDAHMIAADDGTNSYYSSYTRSTTGPTVLCAAPIDNTNSTKGGPYSEGTSAADTNQYGVLAFTWSGGKVTAAFTGYDVDGASETSVMTLNTLLDGEILAVGTPSIPTITASGVSVLAGNLTASGTPSIESPTASGTVTYVHTDTGTPSLDAVTATGQSGFLQDATGTPSTDAITASGSVTYTHKDSGTPAIDSPTATGQSGFLRGASGTPSSDAITASGSVTYIHTDGGTPSIDAVTANGVSSLAGEALSASGTPAIDSPTASGAVTYVHTDSGTPSVDAITAAGQSGFLQDASGTPSVDAITATGAVTYVHTDGGSPAIDAVTAAGVSAFLHDLSGTPLIDTITATGTATVTGLRTASGTPEIPQIVASGTSIGPQVPGGSGGGSTLLYALNWYVFLRH